MNPTKQQCEELISKLARKDLGIGCELRTKSNDAWCPIIMKKHSEELFQIWGFVKWYDAKIIHKDFKIIGHDVYIGDVLEKINDTNGLIKRFPMDWDEIDDNLLELWCPIGYTKSLNQILESFDKEETKQLFKFLIEIFFTNNK